MWLKLWLHGLLAVRLCSKESRRRESLLHRIKRIDYFGESGGQKTKILKLQQLKYG